MALGCWRREGTCTGGEGSKSDGLLSLGRVETLLLADIIPEGGRGQREEGTSYRGGEGVRAIPQGGDCRRLVEKNISC